MLMSPEDLLGNPAYLNVVKQFDPSHVKTILDFQNLVADLKAKFQGAGQ